MIARLLALLLTHIPEPFSRPNEPSARRMRMLNKFRKPN
jgi:hypothetical protein